MEQDDRSRLQRSGDVLDDLIARKDPFEGSDVPEDHRQAEAIEDALDTLVVIPFRGTEQAWREPGHALGDPLGAPDLLANLHPREPRQRGMGVGVIGKFVAFPDDAPRKPRVALDLLPHLEERRLRSVALEDREDLRGLLAKRLVERERDGYAPSGSFPNQAQSRYLASDPLGFGHGGTPGACRLQPASRREHDEQHEDRRLRSRTSPTRIPQFRPPTYFLIPLANLTGRDPTDPA